MSELEDIGLISIIMAAYNAEKTIGQAIKSVIGQTYENWELIVVDDRSTDNTTDIVQKFKDEDARIKLIQNNKNLGVSYTRRVGLTKAEGKWVAVLDSDDAWNNEKLEKQAKLQRKTQAKLLYTGSAFMDEKGRKMEGTLRVPEKISYKKLLKQNLISNSSALVTKELYEQNYVMADWLHEDFAMWLKILKRGITAYGIDEPLLIYRLDKSSKSGNKLKSAKMNWNTYKYIGIRGIEAVYLMICYVINGILKYLRIQKYEEIR